jgi:GNAT superfamily N-acetyltransferase
MDELTLIPLDPRRFQAFERLLSGKEFGGCYCAVWTNHDDQWGERCHERPHENLEHSRRLVRTGRHLGYLVQRVADGEIVGWTGSGPKTLFPLLKDRPGARLGPWSDSVWAIGCLAVGFAHRSRGYTRGIVELVVEEARRAGAESVEAYPLEPASEGASYRGTRKLFSDCGFETADGEASGDFHAIRMVKPLAPTPSERADQRAPGSEGV